jgi:hypothetical protein
MGGKQIIAGDSAAASDLREYRLRPAASRVRHEPMEVADDSPPGVSGRIEGFIEDTAKKYSN